MKSVNMIDTFNFRINVLANSRGNKDTVRPGLNDTRKTQLLNITINQ